MALNKPLFPQGAALNDWDRIADLVGAGLTSPNERDANGEMANVVDGLFAIARAIEQLASTQR